MAIAHLKTYSERYPKWRWILGGDDPEYRDEVPVKDLLPHLAQLGDEIDSVYPLDLDVFTADQRARLIDFICEKFGEKRATVEAELKEFPIREADVTVAIDPRFIL